MLAVLAIMLSFAGCKRSEIKKPAGENNSTAEDLSGRIKDVKKIDLSLPENKNYYDLMTDNASYYKGEIELGEGTVVMENNGSIQFIGSSDGEKRLLLKEEINETEPWESKMYFSREKIDDHRFFYDCGNGYRTYYSGIYDVKTNENHIIEHNGKLYNVGKYIGNSLFCKQYSFENEPIDLDVLEVNIDDYSKKHYPIAQPEGYGSCNYSPDFKLITVWTNPLPVSDDIKTRTCTVLIYNVVDGKIIDSYTFEYEPLEDNIGFANTLFVSEKVIFAGYGKMLYEITLH